VPYQHDGTEQVGLQVQGIEPRHILRRVDAAQRDAEPAHGRVKFAVEKVLRGGGRVDRHGNPRMIIPAGDRRERLGRVDITSATSWHLPNTVQTGTIVTFYHNGLQYGDNVLFC